MKNKIIRIFAIAFSFLSLSSCENMISDVDVPESLPKLVIHSIISPESDFIKVKVMKSRPLYVQNPYYSYDEQFPVIKNASVRISDGVNSMLIPYDVTKDTYSLSADEFEILPSKTYYLEVTAPGGYSVTSECTIPSALPPAIEITSIEEVEEYGQTGYLANFRFQDIAGTGHFYSVTVATSYGDEFYEGEYFYDLYLSRGEPYTSDKNKDGEFFTYKTSSIYTPVERETKIVIFLSVTDKEFYNYHKSVWNFEGDNPFQEPAPIFTNIEGGLGIFAGANTISKEVILSK
jgi:hypothetical protein